MLSTGVSIYVMLFDITILGSKQCNICHCVLMAIFEVVFLLNQSYIQVPVKGGEPIMLNGKEVGYVRRTGDGKQDF